MSAFVSTRGKVLRLRVNRRVVRGLTPARYHRVVQTYGDACAMVKRGPGYGRILPDFLIIGAAKAGTTSLYRWLEDHPLVAFSSVKEPHYFSNYYFRGIHWYRSHFPLHSERDAFAREHGRPYLAGEASPSYLAHYWAPERIARLLPSVKLIVTLRNPIDRGYSHFHMSRRDGDEPLLSFEDAVAAEEERLRFEHARMRADEYYRSFRYGTWSYVTRGHYAVQIERWFEHFPRERFHFLSLEELSARPAETLDAIHAFLELPAHRPDNLAPRHVGEYAPLAPQTRRRLQRELTPHNQRLYELLGRDFGWDA